jgi:hypothetical protein
MKKFGWALLCVVIVACKQQPKPAAASKIRVGHYVSGHWKYFRLYFKDSLVSGYRFDTYFKQIDSVSGTVTDSIRWENIDFSNGASYWPQSGAIRKNGDVFFKDSILLEKIAKKEFDNTVNEAFHPKLIDRDTTLLLGKYILHVQILNWNKEDFSGISTIRIKDKQTGGLLQTIDSNDFVFGPTIDIGYRDCNFDNRKDLVVPLGNVGSYMTRIYDYYLFDPVKNTFAYSEELSMIASTLGVEWDYKNRRVIANNRGSCCSHYVDAYKIIGGQFVKIKKMSAIMDNQENTVVVTETLKKGKWHKTTRTYTHEQFKRGHVYEKF